MSTAMAALAGAALWFHDLRFAILFGGLAILSASIGAEGKREH